MWVTMIDSGDILERGNKPGPYPSGLDQMKVSGGEDHTSKWNTASAAGSLSRVQIALLL